jgi:hypothetical protein
MLLILALAAVAASATLECVNASCSECVASLHCAWCFLSSHFLPDGSLVGACEHRNDTGKRVCFFNHTESECLCAAPVTGCRSCTEWNAACGWCGGRVHRGIGFCSNASSGECGMASKGYAPVVSCPVAGTEAYITWLASIGFGIVLAALVIGIACVKAREEKKRAQRLVSSIFSDPDVMSDGEGKNGTFRGYQDLREINTSV